MSNPVDDDFQEQMCPEIPRVSDIGFYDCAGSSSNLPGLPFAKNGLGACFPEPNRLPTAGGAGMGNHRKGSKPLEGAPVLSASDDESGLYAGQNLSRHFRLLCADVTYATRKSEGTLSPIPAGRNFLETIFIFPCSDTYVAQISLDNSLSSNVGCIHDERTPPRSSPTRRRKRRHARRSGTSGAPDSD